MPVRMWLLLNNWRSSADRLRVILCARQIEANDLFEGLAVSANVGPAIEKERWRALDAERFAFRDVGFDGGFGLWRGHAGMQCVNGACRPKGGDGVLRKLVPSAVGGDDVLIGEDGVLKFQERG